MIEKIKKYLYDILNSIKDIDSFVGEKKYFEIYQNDKKTKSAVERQIAIIGEAINKIKQIDDNLIIENSTKIISVRNRVTHAYDSIDDSIIWAIIINHLPKLKDEIDNLLQND